MRLITTKINCEVKYKKVNENTLAPKPHVIMRNNEGVKVEKKRVLPNGEILPSYHWKLFSEDGKEVAKSAIHYFHMQEDGNEVEVRPFSRTKEIQIIKEVPVTSITDFLHVSTYELFHMEESITGTLYKEAERYLKEDIVGIALFSWGNGFVQYYAIIYPVIREDKFVWVMKLTQAKVEFQHMMEIPTTAKPVSQPPTLKRLPPVEALVVAQ